MVRGRAVRTLPAVVVAALSLNAWLGAQQPNAPVADAAMNHDRDAVRRLLREGGDVNAAQGDGMTALHWAAMNGDADIAGMLLYGGANTRATTRLGGYTALHLAAQNGRTPVIQALLKSAALVNAVTSTGATPLMLAAASGDLDAVTALVDGKADVNATETANGQTALMFAAAVDRAAVVKLLMARGADATVATKVVDLRGVTAPEEDLQEEIRIATQAKSAAATKGAGANVAKTEDRASVPEATPKADGANAAAPAPRADEPKPTEPGRAAPKGPEIPGVTRAYKFNELIGKQGGLTALHYAARQGARQTAEAMVAAGAPVNAVSPADNTSPLLIATINGHFDLAKYFLEHGADPNLASDAGMTPLYAALNVQWAPRMFYPQPRAYLQQQTTYLDLVQLLLDKGADPNARLQRKIWYTQYNFDLLRTDEGGATPFWRAAYASDIDAMKLLVSHGADPNIPTSKPFQGRFFQAGARSTDESRDHSGLPPIPVGGPGVPPLLAAAGVGYGEGFAGNAHRFAPTGMLAAVKYLVEELHVDVNGVDHEGNTAIHHAAARGDNEMIQYLVAHGADVTKVNRGGQTTVDMANGPVQRIQPFPDTITLLEGLGAKNNHKCVSC
ncbi:MAG: ankyrin repeat domain-containing protein [Vicinamibacterales bacterium]